MTAGSAGGSVFPRPAGVRKEAWLSMKKRLPRASFVGVHLTPRESRLLQDALRSGAAGGLPDGCQIRKSWLRAPDGTLRTCIALDVPPDPDAVAAARARLRHVIADLNRRLGTTVRDHPVFWFHESASGADIPHG